MAITPTTSTRFRRAASSERDRLIRQRAKIATKADVIRSELNSLEEEMREVDDRIDSLHGLIGESAVRVVEQAEGEGRVLAGSAIREVAVRVLLASGAADGPIHYRKWFQLLRDAGYDVSGKRPDAVFLNQISRSPVVKATTKAGVYELDLEAPKRLSERLQELQRALSHVAAEVSSGDEGLAKRSAEQEKLSLEIRRTQKALREATQGLDDVTDRKPNQLAA